MRSRIACLEMLTGFVRLKYIGVGALSAWSRMTEATMGLILGIDVMWSEYVENDAA